MKHRFFLLFLAFPSIAFSQASVAYYPFNGLFTVSTNPNRLLWLDARLQTNTPFSLSTTFCPMINVNRTERANYYVGPSIRVNALNAIENNKILEGYALHVGVRVAPVVSLPNLRVAFELSPSVNTGFRFGLVNSYLGVVYQFNKGGSKATL